MLAMQNTKRGEKKMRVLDNEKAYSLGEFGECLIVQDLEDQWNYCQVDRKEFSEFEHEVFNFLVKIEGGV
jgi:hypothetical protein